MAKDKRKILVVSEDNFLMTVSIRFGKIKIKKLVDYDYELHPGCSFSPPINNRYVYMVGGDLSSDVYYYDLKEGCRVLRPGPSLYFETWQPVLILLGFKLFAFSVGRGSPAKPKIQFLDTESQFLDTDDSGRNQWCLLHTSPILPESLPEDIPSYSVVSYAVNINTSDIFVSLGLGKNSLAYCYNDAQQRWSNFSEKRLPFVGQGKFIGLNSYCFAFPISHDRSDLSWYLSAYNLSIDGNTNAKVSCVEMYRYSLVCNYPNPFIVSYLYSVFPTTTTTDQNQVVIVRGTKHRTYKSGKILTLEVNTVRLQNDRLAIPIGLLLNPNPPLEAPLFPYSPPPRTRLESDSEEDPHHSVFSTQVVKPKSRRLSSYALREILGEFYQ